MNKNEYIRLIGEKFFSSFKRKDVSSQKNKNTRPLRDDTKKKKKKKKLKKRIKEDNGKKEIWREKTTRKTKTRKSEPSTKRLTRKL